MYPGPEFHDKVLIFVCHSGYRLVGRPTTLYCNGEDWSSSPPVCVHQPSTTASMSLHSSVVATWTSDERAVTSLDAAAANTTPQVTTSPITPMLLTLSNTGNATFSQSHDSVSLATFVVDFPFSGEVSTSTYTSSSLQLQSTPDWMNDTLLANDTVQVTDLESSEDRPGGRTLLWYAAIVGSCSILLVVGVAACGLVLRRRAPTFRRYQPMDGDEMQSVQAESGKSTFDATQYELTDTYLNDEQQNSLQQIQQVSSNDECSFF